MLILAPATISAASTCYNESYLYDANRYCVMPLNRGYATFSANSADTLLSVGVWRQQDSGVRLGDFFSALGTPTSISQGVFSYSATWITPRWKVVTYSRNADLWGAVKFVIFVALRDYSR